MHVYPYFFLLLGKAPTRAGDGTGGKFEMPVALLQHRTPRGLLISVLSLRRCEVSALVDDLGRSLFPDATCSSTDSVQQGVHSLGP